MAGIDVSGKVRRNAQKIIADAKTLIGDATPTEIMHAEPAVRNADTARTCAVMALFMIGNGKEVEALDALSVAEKCLRIAVQQTLTPHFERSMKHLEGSKKGGLSSAKERAGSDSKRAMIVAAADKYRGAPASRAANIARKVGATPQYVRAVLRAEKGN